MYGEDWCKNGTRGSIDWNYIGRYLAYSDFSPGHAPKHWLETFGRIEQIPSFIHHDAFVACISGDLGVTKVETFYSAPLRSRSHSLHSVSQKIDIINKFVPRQSILP